MSARAFILILVCLFIAGLGAVSAAPFDYDSAWEEIQNLQNKGLPQSMATKVDALYAAAVKDKNIDQQVKALIHQMIIMQSREEFSQQKGIDKIREQLETAQEPLASILHSMLAQQYWSYYVSNRNRFSQRTEMLDTLQEDIATWDLGTITKEAINEYQLSLTHAEELQRVNLTDFPSIVESGGKTERQLRPACMTFWRILL